MLLIVSTLLVKSLNYDYVIDIKESTTCTKINTVETTSYYIPYHNNYTISIIILQSHNNHITINDGIVYLYSIAVQV